MNKLNILMVTEAFYPDGIGGAHTYVYNLSKKLVEKGHSVYVITLRSNKKLPQEENINGINVFRYSSVIGGRFLFIRRPLLSIINSRKVFNDLAKKIKFDIINYHFTLPAFGVNISLKKHDNIPKIFTFHSSMYQEVIIQSKKKQYTFRLFLPLIFLVIKVIEGLVYRWIDKIIVLSNFSKEQLLKIYKVNSQKIEVIPGGIDINEFKPPTDINVVKKKLDLPKDKTILLTVRRLVARMGLENLIKAITEVKKQLPNILLIIAGEGFLRKKLEKLIKEMGLESNIWLKGFLADDELKLFYQAADLFVLPTETLEGFGLVTLEALSSGLPVLGTPLGGTKEILGHFNKNYLFEGTDAKDIAKGIINYLKTTKDPLIISQKCRQFVLENYSWEKVSDVIETVYFKEINKVTRG